MFWNVVELPKLGGYGVMITPLLAESPDRAPAFIVADLLDEPSCTYHDIIWTNMVIDVMQLPIVILGSTELAHRAELIKRLRFISNALEYSTSTLHSTITQLDLFMDAHKISCNTMMHVGLASLSIVAETMEKSGPSISVLSLISGIRLDPNLFHSLKWAIATNMNWELLVPTPAMFASLLSDCIVMDEDVTRREVWLITKIKDEGARLLDAYLDLALIEDMLLISVRADYVACACISCARVELGLVAWPAWLTLRTGMWASTVEPFTNCLLRAMQLLRSGRWSTRSSEPGELGVEGNCCWQLDIDTHPPDPILTEDAPEYLHPLPQLSVSPHDFWLNDVETSHNPLLCETSHDPLLCETSHDPLLCETSHDPLLCEISHDPLLCETSHDPLLCETAHDPLLCETYHDPLLCETCYDPLLCETSHNPLLLETSHDPLLCEGVAQEPSILELVDFTHEPLIPPEMFHFQEIPELIELDREEQLFPDIYPFDELPDLFGLTCLQQIPGLVETREIRQVESSEGPPLFFPGYESENRLNRQQHVNRNEMVPANPAVASIDSLFNLGTPSTSTGLHPSRAAGMHRDLSSEGTAVFKYPRSRYFNNRTRPYPFRRRSGNKQTGKQN